MSTFFNGDGQRLNYDSAPAADKFTWMFWAYHNSFPWNSLWPTYCAITGGTVPCVQLNNGSSQLTIGELVSNTYPGSYIRAKRWYHITWIHNGERDNRLYLDSKLDIYDTNATIRNETPDGISINAQEYHEYNYDCYQAQHRIWSNVILTQQEILREMKSRRAVRRSNLWAEWSLESRSLQDLAGSRQLVVDQFPTPGIASPNSKLNLQKIWWFAGPTISYSYWLTKYNATQEVYATLSTVGSDYLRLWARLVNPTGRDTNLRGYYCQYDGSAVTIHRYNDTGTVDVTIGTWAGTLQSGDKLWMSLDGAVCKVYYYRNSWIEIISATDGSPALDEGYIGLETKNATWVLDDFGGGGSAASVSAEEAISLGKVVKVTQPFAGTQEGTTLTVGKGVSISEQVIVQGALTLAKFTGISATTNVNVFGVTSLAKLDGVSVLETKTVLESSMLARSVGLTSAGARPATEESVALAKFTGITALSQVVVGDTLALAKFIGVTALSQVVIGDTATLARFVGITTISARPTIVETVTLSRSSTQSSGTQTNEKDAVSLAKFIGITVLEETQGFINETVILARSIGIGVLQEGISQVSENVTINRLIGISVNTQLGISENIVLNRLIGISTTAQCQVNNITSLDRLIGISVNAQLRISESTVVNRLIGISTVTQCQVNDNTSLNRLIGISTVTQCQVNDNTSLNRLIGITANVLQFETNVNVVLNRLIGISTTTQCQVNDYLSLTKIIRITVVEETRGQYSENVIIARSIGLTVFQEGISHVSESVNISRLNLLSISEQNTLYNSLIFDRLNGMSVVSQCQIFNNLIFSKSSGLSINAQSIANENITVNKLNGLSTNSQIIAQELINLSRLYGLAILDSRYLLESINLQYGKGLSLVDSPTVFEKIELGRIDIVTIITVLYCYNNITLDQYKSIIAEPPSLYVYNDGNHSTAVLFRDKRVEVLFRDKRASVPWRDKRSNK